MIALRFGLIGDGRMEPACSGDMEVYRAASACLGGPDPDGENNGVSLAFLEGANVTRFHIPPWSRDVIRGRLCLIQTSEDSLAKPNE